MQQRLISITPKALAQIKSVFEKEGTKDAHLRVYVTQGCSHCGSIGYGLAITEKPAEEDVVTENGGIKIVVDKRSVEQLNGAELDYIQTFQRSGFTINNPNVKSGCGCGH